jgi:hypothetical protein
VSLSSWGNAAGPIAGVFEGARLQLTCACHPFALCTSSPCPEDKASGLLTPPLWLIGPHLPHLRSQVVQIDLAEHLQPSEV